MEVSCPSFSPGTGSPSTYQDSQGGDTLSELGSGRVDEREFGLESWRFEWDAEEVRELGELVENFSPSRFLPLGEWGSLKEGSLPLPGLLESRR